MTDPAARFLHAAQLPWTEVKRLAAANAVALVPVGSTEAHGPHLPLSVDVLIAEEVCIRVAHRLVAAQQEVLIFPAVPYGLTEFAASFAGTVSVAAEAFERFLTEVLAGIAGHGFARVAVMNHHLEPGHFALVHRAGQAAATRSGAKVVVPDHRKRPLGPQLGDEFMHGGSHAGRYETSLMLAVAPHLVDDSRRALPDLPVDLPAKIKAGAKNFLECGGEQAYFGSPASATAEEGERLLDLIAEASTAAILALG